MVFSPPFKENSMPVADADTLVMSVGLWLGGVEYERLTGKAQGVQIRKGCAQFAPFYHRDRLQPQSRNSFVAVCFGTI